MSPSHYVCTRVDCALVEGICRFHLPIITRGPIFRLYKLVYLVDSERGKTGIAVMHNLPDSPVILHGFLKGE